MMSWRRHGNPDPTFLVVEDDEGGIYTQQFNDDDPSAMGRAVRCLGENAILPNEGALLRYGVVEARNGGEAALVGGWLTEEQLVWRW